MKRISLVLGLGSMMLAMPAMGATLIGPLDFQGNDAVVGDPPPAPAAPIGLYTTSDIGAGAFTIVDANSTIADPFGGAGNQSLLLNDLDGKTPRVDYRNENAAITGKGEFKATFYGTKTDANGSREQAYFALGTYSTGSKQVTDTGTVLKLTFNMDNDQHIKVSQDDGTGANVDVILDQTYASDTIYHLVIDFDTQAKTFTASLNGTALTADGGAIDTFGFFKNSGNSNNNVNAFTIWSGWNGATNSRVFVDDITLSSVPEPAALSLLGLGGLGLLMRRRRGVHV